MDQIFPTFSHVFASSSADTVSFATYTFPVIVIAFTVMAVVTAVLMIIGVTRWGFDKLISHAGGEDEVSRAKRLSAEFTRLIDKM